MNITINVYLFSLKEHNIHAQTVKADKHFNFADFLCHLSWSRVENCLN